MRGRRGVGRRRPHPALGLGHLCLFGCVIYVFLVVEYRFKSSFIESAHAYIYTYNKSRARLSV